MIVIEIPMVDLLVVISLNDKLPWPRDSEGILTVFDSNDQLGKVKIYSCKDFA